MAAGSITATDAGGTHAGKIDVWLGRKSLAISAKMRFRSDHLLVFLHGLGCAKECFDRSFLVPELSEYSICTFDFPGHGHSARSELFNYSLDAYADVTNAILDRLDLRRVSMVAHSMGGAVGLIASQGRSDIDCFLNIDGNLVSEDCGMASRMTAEQSPADYLRTGHQDFLNSLKEAQRPDFDAWASWCERAEPAALHRIARSLVDWSDSGKLLSIFRSLPSAAYVCGTEDSKQYLVDALGSLPLHQIARTGHFPMLDDPAAFYALLSGLLPAQGQAAAALSSAERSGRYSALT